jgi:serine/threonine protein kinase
MLCPACHAENDDAAEICFDCREVLRAITRGTIIGSRYEIQSLLGRGGMGTVYRALDRVLDEVIALKVLRRLSAIHRVGIVHRDVKSLNIMVDGRGAVKVMDFGIAKHVLAEGSEGVATGYVVGSPESPGMLPQKPRRGGRTTRVAPGRNRA